MSKAEQDALTRPCPHCHARAGDWCRRWDKFALAYYASQKLHASRMKKEGK